MNSIGLRKEASDSLISIPQNNQPAQKILIICTALLQCHIQFKQLFGQLSLLYNQGWHRVMPLPYTEFADRWGNAGFTEYVKLFGAAS